MNVLAKELNETLKGTVVEDLLSSVGRRMYFPKGIVAQSAEAGSKAKLYNATIGLAAKNSEPMYLTDIYSQFASGALRPSDIFSYAPGGGDRDLRALWKEAETRKNPTLSGKNFTLPLVCSGLTHVLSLVGELFVEEGDDVILPNLFWDNYDLIFNDKYGANIIYYDFYDSDGFNVRGLKEAIESSKKDSVRIVLNFPNNPSGYSLTEKEADGVISVLKEAARSGKKLLVVTDDAYFGLFYEEDIYKESLFSTLCDLDENILAIKGDAATKEDMVWGFRIGFISYGFKGAGNEALEALVNKTLGAIRCTVSNCDKPGQSLLLKALKSGEKVQDDKKQIFEEMKGRYLEVKRVLGENKSRFLKPYPFNSGYFMAFDTSIHNAEELRVYLLDKYGIGIINIMNKTLRLAYSSVEKENIEDLIRIIFKAAEEVWN